MGITVVVKLIRFYQILNVDRVSLPSRGDIAYFFIACKDNSQQIMIFIISGTDRPNEENYATNLNNFNAFFRLPLLDKICTQSSLITLDSQKLFSLGL